MIKPSPNFFFKQLSRLYTSIIDCRNWWYDDPRHVTHLGRYTISVGGIHCGGTGKSPLVMMIAGYLLKKNIPVAVLSRGYKRKSKAIKIVAPGQIAGWEECGDEPAMIHARFPNIWLGIGADRRKVAHALCSIVPANAVFILDDGFSHRKAHRDRDIVSLPAPLCDDFMLPAGYLREPWHCLERASAICLIGSITNDPKDKEDGERVLRGIVPSTTPIVHVEMVTGSWINLNTGQTAQLPVKRPSEVVCGIARPHRFINTITEMGIIPLRTHIFQDHHPFSLREISKIASRDVQILTTEKDAIRLASLGIPETIDIWYLQVDLVMMEKKQQEFLTQLIIGKS